MLRLTVSELAERSSVAPNTVVRVVAEKPVNTGTLSAFQQVLEAAGVIFMPENGEGPGVRLRKAASPANSNGKD
ncbi:transcriptional regulator [Roseomonas indoligenes]|nr:transcriptional regulator [Pararoseomonas indoligenes]